MKKKMYRVSLTPRDPQLLHPMTRDFVNYDDADAFGWCYDDEYTWDVSEVDVEEKLPKTLSDQQKLKRILESFGATFEVFFAYRDKRANDTVRIKIVAKPHGCCCCAIDTDAFRVLREAAAEKAIWQVFGNRTIHCEKRNNAEYVLFLKTA